MTHPNAIAGGVSGVGGGVFVVYLLHQFGYEVDPMLGAVIAGALSTVVLFVGRNGLRGALRAIWKGKS